MFYASRPHTIRTQHWLGRLWLSDQLVAETATYITQRTQRGKSMLSGGFEQALPVTETVRPPGSVFVDIIDGK
jgi:hypothetical protein